MEIIEEDPNTSVDVHQLVEEVLVQNAESWPGPWRFGFSRTMMCHGNCVLNKASAVSLIQGSTDRLRNSDL